MAEFWRYENGRFQRLQRPVVREAAVTLIVNGEPLGAMMVTPDRLDEFAVGFLYLEEVYDRVEQVEAVEVNGEEVHLRINGARPPEECKFRTSSLNRRNTEFAEASNDAAGALPSPEKRLTPNKLLQLVRALNTHAEAYRETGGVHTAALSSPDGAFLVAEDVGRNNAIDKIMGRCLLQGIDPRDGALIASGRITMETVQKAHRMQTPIMISRTSPTDMAIALAEQFCITLVGYARGGAFNVYTHAGRIDIAPALSTTKHEVHEEHEDTKN